MLNRASRRPKESADLPELVCSLRLLDVARLREFQEHRPDGLPCAAHNRDEFRNGFPAVTGRAPAGDDVL